MNTKIPNIEVIRSLWRRVKKDIEVIHSAWRPRVKKDIKVRDLKPGKDVKGGGGLTGESEPITGGTGTADTTSTWRYVPKKTNPKQCADDYFVPRPGPGSEQPPLAGGVHGLVQSLYHSFELALVLVRFDHVALHYRKRMDHGIM